MSNTPWWRRSVFTWDSGPVHTEDDREVLERDVVYDRVVRALQERGVNCHYRPHSLGGESGGEGDAMRFGDAHVEIPLGVGP